MLKVHPSKAHLLVQFIVMVIPSMTSSRVFVRKSLAAVLDELAHILAAEVEAFLAEERRARDGYYEKVEIKMDGGEGAELSPKERRMRKFTPKMLAVAVSQKSELDDYPTDYQNRRVYKRYSHLYKVRPGSHRLGE